MAVFDSFLGKIIDVIVNPLIELMFAIAILYFIYGAFVFIINQDNEEAKSTGKSSMLWGIVGMAIMMSVWGIMNLITHTFGFDRNVKIENQNNQGSATIDLK